MAQNQGSDSGWVCTYLHKNKKAAVGETAAFSYFFVNVNVFPLLDVTVNARRVTV